MKLSFDWLSDYVDLTGVKVDDVREALTMGAFEVEEVRPVRAFEIKGPVVVGEILDIYPHPDATKIRLTKTRVAPGAEPLVIVCGAANIEVGQRVPVALSGSSVIDRQSGKPLAIESRPVRGVVSNGMLCSPPELGLNTEANEGILVLPHSADNPLELGTDIKELLSLRQDWVLFVEPRSNRGDALSVIGMAREVAALLKRPLRQPPWQLPQEETGQDEFEFSVHIERSNDCPFFSTRIIADLTTGPSPALIQRRLEAVDVRCVNNIVDITNYVMHEFGQPLHAYDYERVGGHSLSTRRALPGEKLLTLDGKEHELSEEVLVIADAQGVVGVAGIMGGKESEIGNHTGTVALEAAAFQPARVRRGSRLLGLSSDSSLRFERGVDVASVSRASDRAAFLMIEHCAAPGKKPRLGKKSCDGHDAVRPVHVTCRMKQLKRVLDLEFTTDQVKELLTPLGFEVVKGSSRNEAEKDAVQVGIPSFRQTDITREIDIVEEVCRLWGYDKLPVCMPLSTIAPDRPEHIFDTTKDTLSGLGLSEAWLSSLIGGDEIAVNGFGLYDEDKAVRVLNPLSAEHQVLRQSLLPGLIKAASYNFDRNQQDVWLFEVGRVYVTLKEGETAEYDLFKTGTGVLEEHHVAGFMMGSNARSAWSDHASPAQKLELDFYLCKGVVENLLKRLRVDLENVQFLRSDKVPQCMHPSRACQIALTARRRSNKDEPTQVFGWIAELHPALRETMRFKQPAYLFEMNLDALRITSSRSRFAEIPVTPVVTRDLTVDVFEAVDHAAVNKCIQASAGKNLESIELVSIYQPAEGQKSLSFRLTFQSPEKTLTTEEVDTELARVRRELSNRLSGTFRA